MAHLVARVPKRLPQDVPMGCRARDPGDLWQQYGLQRDGLPLDAAWRLWLDFAERDWADVYGLDIEADSEYFGRSEGPRFQVCKPQAPRDLAFPRLSPGALWWRLLARCFDGLGVWQPGALRYGTLKLARSLPGLAQKAKVAAAKSQPWLHLL
eukprot:7465539-Pyramimonas_sp.AAC.1